MTLKQASCDAYSNALLISPGFGGAQYPARRHAGKAQSCVKKSRHALKRNRKLAFTFMMWRLTSPSLRLIWRSAIDLTCINSTLIEIIIQFITGLQVVTRIPILVPKGELWVAVGATPSPTLTRCMECTTPHLALCPHIARDWTQDRISWLLTNSAAPSVAGAPGLG